MPSHVSGELPNALERRIAISGEIPLLPLTMLFTAWRVTPSTLAAAVTDSPSGSRQSSRTDSPGCGGFFIGMAFFQSEMYSDNCHLSLYLQNCCYARRESIEVRTLAIFGPDA